MTKVWNESPRIFEAAGFQVVWARAPISVRNVELPSGLIPLSVYPLARYLRAFDAFVGAAGYNTCCELVQSGIPALLVPNALLADDQVRRAQMVAGVMPAVVSACETEEQRNVALDELLRLTAREGVKGAPIPMNGASLAADEIMAVVAGRGRRH